MNCLNYKMGLVCCKIYLVNFNLKFAKCKTFFVNCKTHFENFKTSLEMV